MIVLLNPKRYGAVRIKVVMSLHGCFGSGFDLEDKWAAFGQRTEWSMHNEASVFGNLRRSALIPQTYNRWIYAHGKMKFRFERPGRE